VTRRSKALTAAVTVIVLYAIIAAMKAIVPASDPHGFMRDPSRCVECHMESRPASGRPYALMNFRKDIVSLCTRCHPAGLTHPVEVAPGQGRGRRLPLDTDGTMTCITCHAPHEAPYSDRIRIGRTLYEKVRDTFFPFSTRRFRTYFLRIPSLRGELCEDCHAKLKFAERTDISAADPALYAGSRVCAGCHEGRYRQWRKSPHARMLRSPRRDASSVLAHFTGSAPFPPSEIAFVLGSRNVQRFISRKGDSFVVRTPIWMIRARDWNLSYWREMDWLKLCAGCHTTGFNPFQGQFAEEGISCEACHGPGRRHAQSRKAGDIVHPGKIPEMRRSMICESCHTTGHDATGEYRFPVGYLPGSDLRRFYFGLTPKPGQDDVSFKGDGSYEDRHTQYLFWRSRMLIREGETCDLCKNFRVARRENQGTGPRTMTPREFCLSCHDGTVVPPPRFHPADGIPENCGSCHPPDLSGNGEISIHDHKYVPFDGVSKKDFLPSADFRSICFSCHPAPGKGAVNPS
jgi:hypothetical protein